MNELNNESGVADVLESLLRYNTDYGLHVRHDVTVVRESSTELHVTVDSRTFVVAATEV